MSASTATSLPVGNEVRDEPRGERPPRATRYGPEAFVGSSAAARDLREMLRRVAEVPISALIVSGETGTGKGLVARILHDTGQRADGPLVELNCAAVPKDLLESELFGYEPGAFTGAKGRHRGLLEQAHGGTLLLDEIGEMAPDLQVKLLKAIEERSFRRLGGERPIEVDVQIIAATSRDLRQETARGSFRRDLYHRLSVFELALPALRERREDIDGLVEGMIAEFNVLADKRVRVVPGPVLAALQAHDWPGNVRELRNVIERCVLFSVDEALPARWLQLRDDPPEGGGSAGMEVEGERVAFRLDGRLSLDRIERTLIGQALELERGNLTAAARRLGVSRETLRYRVDKHHLVPPGRDPGPGDGAA